MYYFLFHFGRCILLLRNSLRKPDNRSIYFQQLVKECISIGINSFLLTLIISGFVGSVTTFQTAYQIDSGFIPKYIIGMVTRDSSILELSPTLVGLILAGKLGSSITSQIGTMRITEQIDALVVMGVNTESYLILPKIIAALFMVPILVIFSIVFSILGGYISASFSTMMTASDYIQGILWEFKPYYFVVAMVKAAVYAISIVAIASYQGFFVNGGSEEVGKASTRAVTFSCFTIILMDYLLVLVLL